MELSNLTVLVQVAITLLVASLLHELTGVVTTRFLAYWSRGWLALAVALVAVVASMRIDIVFGPGSVASLFCLIVYCSAEYVFGFYLWAGCRNYRTGETDTRRDYRWLAVPAVAAIALPLWFRTIGDLFPAHSALMAVLFGISTFACRRKSKSEPMLIGLRLIRISLYGLTLLFAHYAIVVGWWRYRYPHLQFVHMDYSSLYDAAFEVGLAMGMVLLATESVRVELLERNRKLAAATEELERAARTDPLTGLLNRRAFDEVAADPNGPGGAVAVLDLNDLKPINDEFGHSAGDVALQLVARALRIHSRVTDPLYRLGGDEYAVVMPGCTPDELAFRLTKIDASLVGQRLPGADRPIDLSVSWGVATYESAAGLKAAAIEADVRMFSQKKKRKGGARASLSSVSA